MKPAGPTHSSGPSSSGSFRPWSGPRRAASHGVPGGRRRPAHQKVHARQAVLDGGRAPGRIGPRAGKVERAGRFGLAVHSHRLLQVWSPEPVPDSGCPSQGRADQDISDVSADLDASATRSPAARGKQGPGLRGRAPGGRCKQRQGKGQSMGHRLSERSCWSRHWPGQGPRRRGLNVTDYYDRRPSIYRTIWKPSLHRPSKGV